MNKGSRCPRPADTESWIVDLNSERNKKSCVAHPIAGRGHHVALKLAIPSLHAPHRFACSVSSLGRYPCHYLLGHLSLRCEDPVSCMLQRDKLSACFAGHDPRWDARHRPAPVQVTGRHDPPQRKLSSCAPVHARYGGASPTIPAGPRHRSVLACTRAHGPRLAVPTAGSRNGVARGFRVPPCAVNVPLVRHPRGLPKPRASA